jgi:hypothetical protein
MPRPVSVTRSFSTATVPRLATTPVAITRPAYRVPAAPPPSNAPSQTYLRHHDVTAPRVDSAAFRQGWRVVTRLDGLLEAGRIDREQWDAACRWRRWAERITPSRQPSWGIRIDDAVASSHADIGMLHRVDVATRLRNCATALGTLRVRLLEACVRDDLSWRAIAERLQISDKTAREHAAEAVAALADWLAGRSVPPPPELRYRHNGIGAR